MSDPLERFDVDKRAQAQRVLSLLDLTSLGEDDRPEQILSLCSRARWHGGVAAVCIYPEHVGTARNALRDSCVKIASVVNFPDAGSDAMRVWRETRRALAAGADEIDVVMPWPAFCNGDIESVRAALRATREACSGGQIVKLILESGELASAERIRSAAQLGIEAGMDFLKTSTGKASVNATPEAAAIMLDVIAAHGGRCGFKAAGGIRTLDDVATYLDLARQRLGDAWIAPDRFRIGASSLHDALIPLLHSD
jgi:deoxyribose-phosphate aldolase